MKQLLPVLKRAQAKLNVLPKRRVKTDSELEEAIETVGKPLEQLSDLTSTVTPSVEQPAKDNFFALEKTASSSSIEADSSSSSKTKLASVATTIESTATPPTEAPLVLIDVTERSHFRPKNNLTQKKYYSGKKKRHTVKNTLISDTKRRVIFLGRTFKGSSHDYKMFKQEFPSSQFGFSPFKIAVDLGYQGIKKDYPSALPIFIIRNPKNQKPTQILL